MKLKRPSLVSQGSLSRIFQASGEAWKRCDFQPAIEMMERASRLDPANAGILLDLGRMYGMRYDYAAAERCFEQAVRVTPKKSDSLAAAGQQSRDFANFEMAERYYLRALEQKDATPETFVKLAELYERLRRTDDAAKLIDRALYLDANCASALLLRAKLDRQAGQLDEAEKLLRSLLTAADKEIRARGLYELGGILDRRGRYDDAMTAFLEAKSLLQFKAARASAELKIMRARIKHLTAN
ncbi:MAG: tetratricopeptide repeat protein, partial [Limisphaerales bacterium]